MKRILFWIFVCLYNFFQAQDSLFIKIQELHFGINREFSLRDTSFLGFNVGYSQHINSKKSWFYRLNLQYTKQFFDGTHSEGKDPFYTNLLLQNFIFQNMISYRFYNKKSSYYFELGAFFSLDFYQQKNGIYHQIVFNDGAPSGSYSWEQTTIKENKFFAPNSLGLQFGSGLQVSQHIFLKPEIQIHAYSFLRNIIHGWDGQICLASFNVSYKF